MTRDITPAGSPATGAVDEAYAEVRASFDRFCLAAGIEALGTMMEADVTAACGPRHGRDAARRAHRWGRTRGRIGFHGGKIEVERPRVRGMDGREVTIPSWETAAQEDWLGRWAMNLMLINVSTRRFGRAVRLPEGDVPAPPGSGVSKSAASRRFVALSAARLADFMAADLSALDLLVVQIDGLHLGDDLVLVAAIGVDGEGNKHPLALVKGRPRMPQRFRPCWTTWSRAGSTRRCQDWFIADGAKALSKAIRRTFGPAAAIQRCQIHKARNIMERLPKEHHGATRRVLRQAWELDDADKAEKLIRNLARRLDQQWPGVAASILEGLDEILTVVRLKLPKELRRSLACTNIAENMMGTIRRVTRNVKRWRDAGMALRWVAAGMIEANKGFRRLKAHKQLSVLRAALQAHHNRMTINSVAHVTRAA
ncbi:IS256 family transposase [Bradyrhizobium sp. LA2.1]|uniref:IS256 family transposase n=1 Tax=Bradyrhizobium sp. LA2.1 TaxID=3156376 RepID=UPI0033930C7B